MTKYLFKFSRHKLITQTIIFQYLTSVSSVQSVDSNNCSRSTRQHAVCHATTADTASM